MSKLYKILNDKDNPLIIPSVLNEWMNRLCIMEAVAACKFVMGKPPFDESREAIVYDNLREKLKELPDDQIEFIITIFRSNIEIAKLIQTACIEEWGSSDKQAITKVAVQSISVVLKRAVTDDESENLLGLCRKFLTGLTDQIITELKQPSNTNTGSYHLSATIQNAYPNINQHRLDNELESLRTALVQLSQARNTVNANHSAVGFDYNIQDKKPNNEKIPSSNLG